MKKSIIATLFVLSINLCMMAQQDLRVGFSPIYNAGLSIEYNKGYFGMGAGVIQLQNHSFNGTEHLFEFHWPDGYEFYLKWNILTFGRIELSFEPGVYKSFSKKYLKGSYTDYDVNTKISTRYDDNNSFKFYIGGSVNLLLGNKEKKKFSTFFKGTYMVNNKWYEADVYGSIGVKYILHLN